MERLLSPYSVSSCSPGQATLLPLHFKARNPAPQNKFTLHLKTKPALQSKETCTSKQENLHLNTSKPALQSKETCTSKQENLPESFMNKEFSENAICSNKSFNLIPTTSNRGVCLLLTRSCESVAIRQTKSGRYSRDHRETID